MKQENEKTYLKFLLNNNYLPTIFVKLQLPTYNFCLKILFKCFVITFQLLCREMVNNEYEKSAKIFRISAAGGNNTKIISR